MGLMRKKGASGTAKTYITRTQAIKKLQISLSNFKQLCILKGIYPREPKHKSKLRSSDPYRTFYHVKDIRYLLHEPLLNKFREYSAFQKKFKRLVSKRNWDSAERFVENKPTYSLDTIIKARYPTFLDAVRDLDDALCHLFLFSRVPREQNPGLQNHISSEAVARICNEFLRYVMETKALRKAFLSIKGIYYEAEISGQQVVWLTPYDFSIPLPRTVDWKVMENFLELYKNLLEFVNFKLYNDTGLIYPPKVDETLEKHGLGLMSLVLESNSFVAPSGTHVSEQNIPELSDRISSLKDKMPQIISNDLQSSSAEPSTDNENTTPAAEEEGDFDLTNNENSSSVFPQVSALNQKNKDLATVSSLFRGLVFFISREVNKDALIFCIKCFGGKVGWAHTLLGSPLSEDDPSITHQIIDRPLLNKIVVGRTYVQPQWVFDSLNLKKLVAVDSYLPGATLPPHLSPFATYDSDEPQKETTSDKDGNPIEILNDEDEALVLREQEFEIQYKKEIEEEAKGVSFTDFNNNKSDNNTEESTPAKANKKAKTKTDSTNNIDLPEDKKLALLMMSNKKRKLYLRMKRANDTKDQEKNRLKARKEEIQKKKKDTV